MVKSHILYTLTDPNTNEVRYVGMTKNPSTRLSVHIRSSKYHPKNSKERWIHGLISNGQEPVMEMIETCDSGTWQEREKFWIDYYRTEGCDLTNISNGGYGKGDSRPKGKTVNRAIINNPIGNNVVIEPCDDKPIIKRSISLNLSASARAIIYTSDEIIVMFKGSKNWVRIPLED